MSFADFARIQAEEDARLKRERLKKLREQEAAKEVEPKPVDTSFQPFQQETLSSAELLKLKREAIAREAARIEAQRTEGEPAPEIIEPAKMREQEASIEALFEEELKEPEVTVPVEEPEILRLQRIEQERLTAERLRKKQEEAQRVADIKFAEEATRKTVEEAAKPVQPAPTVVSRPRSDLPESLKGTISGTIFGISEEGFRIAESRRKKGDILSAILTGSAAVVVEAGAGVVTAAESLLELVGGQDVPDITSGVVGSVAKSFEGTKIDLSKPSGLGIEVEFTAKKTEELEFFEKRPAALAGAIIGELITGAVLGKALVKAVKPLVKPVKRIIGKAKITPAEEAALRAPVKPKKVKTGPDLTPKEVDEIFGVTRPKPKLEKGIIPIEERPIVTLTQAQRKAKIVAKRPKIGAPEDIEKTLKRLETEFPADEARGIVRITFGKPPEGVKVKVGRQVAITKQVKKLRQPKTLQEAIQGVKVKRVPKIVPVVKPKFIQDLIGVTKPKVVPKKKKREQLIIDPVTSPVQPPGQEPIFKPPRQIAPPKQKVPPKLKPPALIAPPIMGPVFKPPKQIAPPKLKAPPKQKPPIIISPPKFKPPIQIAPPKLKPPRQIIPPKFKPPIQIAPPKLRPPIQKPIVITKPVVIQKQKPGTIVDVATGQKQKEKIVPALISKQVTAQKEAQAFKLATVQVFRQPKLGKGIPPFLKREKPKKRRLRERERFGRKRFVNPLAEVEDVLGVGSRRTRKRDKGKSLGNLNFF